MQPANISYIVIAGIILSLCVAAVVVAIVHTTCKKKRPAPARRAALRSEHPLMDAIREQSMDDRLDEVVAREMRRHEIELKPLPRARCMGEPARTRGRGRWHRQPGPAARPGPQGVRILEQIPE
ncbi:hypothetical protein QQZ08_010099 [Neonectria magnoliae]|uniref:Uncharacterized protein n=1 Tax=Neonectria magnoliae TaxID=2732573 RepID=A0ABR1HJW7_9HYPO